MNNSTMKPGASPGGTGVRRLNRVPILILIGIIGLVLAGLGWALYQRGQMVQGGEGAAGDQPIEARDTGMLADLLAGYQQGHVVEGTRPAEDKPEMPEIPEALVYIEPDQRRPIPQPVRTVPAPVSPPLPQPVQPAPDPEPTPAEIAAGQRRLQADEMLYQSLLQALSAPTAVQGGAQGGGSQGGSRASALPPARTAGAAGAITPGAGESRTGLQQQALARQAQQQARQDELAERGLTALDALAAGLQQGAVSRTGSPDSSSGTGSGSGAGTKGTGGTGRLAGTGGFSGTPTGGQTLASGGQGNRDSAAYGYSTEQRRVAQSATELRVGTLIPAVMLSGINSDLPGEMLAQVSEDVRDSRTGRYILIPKGSKLVGRYASDVAEGQERVLVAWYRVNFPDDSFLNLDTMGGMDQAGYAGFTDQVDRHTFDKFKESGLLSILSGLGQLSQSGEDDASQQMAASMGQGWAQVGQELVRRKLDMPATLQIRPGYRFNIFINKDLVLKPYQPEAPLSLR